ncbi:MAG: hydrogenase formation protein HypD [Clostridia bacterium]|nr:hydrogenase formation protein HypD [Clostridia bacterium]
MQNKEFRDPLVAQKLVQNIERLVTGPVNLMEVCGTHTMAIFRHGIRQMLPEKVKLLSGPGCPVCVTPDHLLDLAMEIARQPGVLLTTFGDMLRVPGSRYSLETLKAAGANVKVVYSPLEALKLAEEHPEQEVVFFAVGFETTAPVIAATIITAEQKQLTNFSVIGNNKTIPGALRALLSSGEVKVDGLLCPGHVSAVIGSEPYRFIPEELGIGAVITGFEPVDILQGIYLLLQQIQEGRPRVEIQYSRWVPPQGNPQALKLMEQVFDIEGTQWRGLGYLPGTGLKITDRYRQFDATWRFNIVVKEQPPKRGCRCGEVLRGIITPLECPLFAKACVPERPVGACMVSVEGTCAAYYKYGR